MRLRRKLPPLLPPVNAQEFEKRIENLNKEQRENYEIIKEKIDEADWALYHIDAYGGTGEFF